jgi:hypothetical protein
MVGKHATRRKPTKPPGLEFRYSWQYDQENRLRFTDPLYPSGDEIREYIGRVRAAWRPRQRTLMGSISRTSGLPWRESLMVCYVVGRGVPMSDPLTLPVYKGQEGLFVDKLVYELIERLLMHPENLRARSGFWEGMFRSMSSDGVKVSYMVPVNAIYRDISTGKAGSGDSEESLVSTNLDFRRAWEIVSELGHKEIIERFREGRWD